MIKVKTCTQVFSTRFLFNVCRQVMALTPCDDSFESSLLYSFRSTRPMTPSSATPGPREEKVLYNLLSVVWPHVSTCGKKEPMSTHCNPGSVPQEVTSLYIVVPHGDFKTISPLSTLCRLRSRNHLKLPCCNVSSPFTLSSDTDHVGRARHKAGPIPYDQHPCHRNDCFLFAAARMPYPRELRKEHRVLGYGHP